MKYIKQRRERIGINQTELSNRLNDRGFNVTRATIGHWEQGRYNAPMFDPNFVSILAESLETDTLTLLIEAGYDIKIDHSLEAEFAAGIIERMTPDQRETALNVLRAMVKTSV